MINNILINAENRNIKSKDSDFLGVSGENNIEQLVFKLTAFIVGTAILEIEKYNKEDKKEKYFLALRRDEESYILDVKNSLLDVSKNIRMQLHITTENEEVFKSKVFELKVREAIEATETIPEEYESWIDIANSKISALDRLEEEVKEKFEEIEDLSEDYRELAEQKAAELNNIADTARDMVSAVTFSQFGVDLEDMEVYIDTPEKLGNAGFSINDEGELEVEINE